MEGPDVAEISRQIIEILETAVQEPYLIGKKPNGWPHTNFLRWKSLPKFQ